MYDNDKGSSPSSGNSTPGEYHYIRPDSRHSWSDAGYETVTSASRVPHVYDVQTPSEKPKKSHARRGGISPWFLLCACMLCAVIGGVAGAAGLNYMYEKNTPEAEASEAEPSPSPAVLPPVSASVPAVESTEAIPAPTAVPAFGSTLYSAPELPEGVLTGTQIYSIACNQAVAITSEITYTNIFGYTSSGAVSGSGFIISEDGYILTNYHVISKARQNKAKITVLSYDGTEYNATIAGFDDDNDVALLKVQAEGLDAVTIGDSSSIQVGETVYAVGNPMGELAFSQTCGTISALDRVINTSSSYSGINMFQIDAAVNSGNSGGPLYNARGEVIGMVTAKYSEEGVEGLGFAIPINDAVSLANELLTKGYISGKAHIGVEATTLSPTISMFYNLPSGAYVEYVEKNSSAVTAGIEEGDLIVAVGDSTISSASDLIAVTKSHSAGDTVELTVYRSGKVISLTFTFDEEIPDNIKAS